MSQVAVQMILCSPVFGEVLSMMELYLAGGSCFVFDVFVNIDCFIVKCRTGFSEAARRRSGKERHVQTDNIDAKVENGKNSEV